MFSTGSTIRSAKMKAATPPKLIPPFQSTAASGTFPTEQTNEAIATSGPTIGPQNFANVGCDARKNAVQECLGTPTARAPASSRPPAISFQIETQSITK